MKPMRVLTVGHSYVVALNRAVLAKVSKDPGIDLTVVAPRFFHGELRKIPLEIPEAPPYRLVALPAHGTRSPHMFFYAGLMPVVRSGAFDLVHAWEEPFVVAGYQVARAAHACGVRYFFWTAQNLSKRYPPPFSHFERYCLRHACGWLAGGHTVQQTLLARGYPRTLAEIITHHVDEERFRPDPAEGAEMRRRLGLKGPVVGYSGRLTEEKGMNVLMAALERVPGDWSLLALGGGPYEAKLRQWAESRGWSDRLRIMLVKHGEVPSYFRAMDLVVVPSQSTPRWKEQFGRVVIEAFACGVPVIASDSGEIPHVVGGAGMIVPESDVNAWTEAIAGLLESPDRRRELAAAGYARCERHYFTQRIADDTINYYRKIMDTPAPARGRAARHAGV